MRFGAGLPGYGTDAQHETAIGVEQIRALKRPEASSDQPYGPPTPLLLQPQQDMRDVPPSRPEASSVDDDD